MSPSILIIINGTAGKFDLFVDYFTNLKHHSKILLNFFLILIESFPSLPAVALILPNILCIIKDTVATGSEC
jgi:hypothetical protein